MKYTLPFDPKDKDSFDKIKAGIKKIETRAGGPKYENIVVGDSIIFECDRDSFERTITKVIKFKGVDEMLNVYKPKEINAAMNTAEDLKALYRSFPGYIERLEKFGIIAFEI